MKETIQPTKEEIEMITAERFSHMGVLSGIHKKLKKATIWSPEWKKLKKEEGQVKMKIVRINKILDAPLMKELREQSKKSKRKKNINAQGWKI